MVNKLDFVRGMTAASAIAYAGLACAQTTPNAEAATAETSDEIVVMAQKRSENVQDVPISISAFTGSTLAKANVTSVADLPRIAPNLQFDSGLSAAKARFIIRGIGSAGGTAVEPSVATFLDGIYLPREGSTLSAYMDLAGLEVLRGPQGTLFGRNASVGAINLRSADPTEEFSGHVSAEAGTGERYKMEGVLNAPIGEGASLRFAGMGELFSGFYKNRLDGKTLGGVDSAAARISGKFDISSNLTAIIRVNYSKRKGDGFANYALIGSTIPPAQRATFLQLYANIGSPLDLEPFDRTVNQYSGDRLNDRQWGVTSNITYDTPGGFSIRLLSGYTDWDSDQIGTSAFAATVPVLTQFIGWKSDSISQELQFISPQDELLGGRLDFVAGLYYFHEKYQTTESHQYNEGQCRLVFRNLAAPLFNSCLANANTVAFNQRFRQTTDSIAAYGQATFNIVPMLDLVLGARWTQDKKKARMVQVPTALIGNFASTLEDTPLRLKDDRPTWRANLNFRPSDDAMIFASYSTGYKSGGFNSQTAPADALGPLGQRRAFRAETVRNMELGLKSEWLDRAITFNATLYRMKVKNFQDRSYNGINFSLQNAGDIRNQGVELEAILKPTEGLRFNFSTAYLESKFTRALPSSNLPGLPGLRDITGLRPTFTPEWQGNAGLEYGSAIPGSSLSFLVRTDLSFISDNNIGTINDANPITTQPGFSLLSARATLFGPEERWSVYVFANNIFDKGYCTSYAYQPFGGLISAIGPGGRTALRCNTVAPPRTLAAGASFRF